MLEASHGDSRFYSHFTDATCAEAETVGALLVDLVRLDGDLRAALAA